MTEPASRNTAQQRCDHYCAAVGQRCKPCFTNEMGCGGVALKHIGLTGPSRTAAISHFLCHPSPNPCQWAAASTINSKAPCLRVVVLGSCTWPLTRSQLSNVQNVRSQGGFRTLYVTKGGGRFELQSCPALPTQSGCAQSRAQRVRGSWRSGVTFGQRTLQQVLLNPACFSKLFLCADVCF